MDTTISSLKARIAKAGVTRGELAGLCKYDHSAFSHYLSGRRRLPSDFWFVVTEALQAIEAAQAAYHEALAERGYEQVIS